MINLPAKLKLTFSSRSSLLKITAVLFLAFLLLGLLIGYFIEKRLKNNGDAFLNTLNLREEMSYEGKITYVDPNFYPQDDVKYVLKNSSGKDIVLLSSDDEKLTVVEGLYAKVFGEIRLAKDNKTEILVVDKVIISNK